MEVGYRRRATIDRKYRMLSGSNVVLPICIIMLETDITRIALDPSDTIYILNIIVLMLKPVILS